MIEKDDAGVNVIVLGSGDIEVCSGHLDDPEENWTFVSFGQSTPGEINRVIKEEDAHGCKSDTIGFKHHTRLAFTDPRSIDVVIHHLKEAKCLMLSELTRDILGGKL